MIIYYMKTTHNLLRYWAVLAILSVTLCLSAQDAAVGFSNVSLEEENIVLNMNKPEREKWFSDLGFGMFIHWSLDVNMGMVISHSMVGASEDYLDRYINDLPGYFDPQDFQPERWARLAKMAGMKYMVFTTKHHSGFCMYNTETTDFNVMNTPFATDATKAFIDACRKEGLAVGIYFSPDDFYFPLRSHDRVSFW